MPDLLTPYAVGETRISAPVDVSAAFRWFRSARAKGFSVGQLKTVSVLRQPSESGLSQDNWNETVFCYSDQALCNRGLGVVLCLLSGHLPFLSLYAFVFTCSDFKLHCYCENSKSGNGIRAGLNKPHDLRSCGILVGRSTNLIRTAGEA